MSDAPKPGAGPTPQGEVPPQFLLNSQYVKDLSFENPNAPQVLQQSDQRPNIQVNVNVEARTLGPDMYEVELKLAATAKREELTLFIAELVYAGVFTIRGFPQEHLQLAVLVQCPTLLFPFARRVLADVIRDGGFPPLLLEPINFLELLQRQQQAAQQQMGQGGPTGTA
jgi:preprotein translocase subunit SecB